MADSQLWMGKLSIQDQVSHNKTIWNCTVVPIHPLYYRDSNAATYSKRNKTRQAHTGKAFSGIKTTSKSTWLLQKLTKVWQTQTSLQSCWDSACTKMGCVRIEAAVPRPSCLMVWMAEQVGSNQSVPAHSFVTFLLFCMFYNVPLHAIHERSAGFHALEPKVHPGLCGGTGSLGTSCSLCTQTACTIQLDLWAYHAANSRPNLNNGFPVPPVYNDVLVRERGHTNVLYFCYAVVADVQCGQLL